MLKVAGIVHVSSSLSPCISYVLMCLKGRDLEGLTHLRSAVKLKLRVKPVVKGRFLKDHPDLVLAVRRQSLETTSGLKHQHTQRKKNN